MLVITFPLQGVLVFMMSPPPQCGGDGGGEDDDLSIRGGGAVVMTDPTPIDDLLTGCGWWRR